MTATAAKGNLNAVARDIARVAARLFATQGYEATSVREIVEAAGVTKPTLYYYFGSKEGLAQAILTMPMETLAHDLRAILDSGSEPVTALGQIVDAHFAFCREYADGARFFFALSFGPQGRELMREVKRSMGVLPELLIEGVRRLADAGLIAPERVGACATTCRGMIVIAMMDFLYRDRHPDCAHTGLEHLSDLGPGLADRLVGDLLHGFALPGAPGRGVRS
jgi:AcrR family transcriptional regulator